MRADIVAVDRDFRAGHGPPGGPPLPHPAGSGFKVVVDHDARELNRSVRQPPEVEPPRMPSFDRSPEAFGRPPAQAAQCRPRSPAARAFSRRVTLRCSGEDLHHGLQRLSDDAGPGETEEGGRKSGPAAQSEGSVCRAFSAAGAFFAHARYTSCLSRSAGGRKQRLRTGGEGRRARAASGACRQVPEFLIPPVEPDFRGLQRRPRVLRDLLSRPQLLFQGVLAPAEG